MVLRGALRVTAVVCLVGSSLGLAACASSTRAQEIPLTEDEGSTTLPGEKPSASSSSSSSSSSGGGGGTLCERVCDKAASAKCSAQATCVKDCEADMGQIPAGCNDEADAALECAATKATSFTCDSKGRAKAKGCDAEGQALVQCVLGGGSSSGGSSSGGSSSGGTGCGTLTSNDPACDTCVNASCCAQAAACSNDAECGAILSCFSSCTTNACFTQCENAHPSGVAKEQAFYTCLGTSCSTACQ